jgi:aspartate/methionine/tyrosine aminotransferase
VTYKPEEIVVGNGAKQEVYQAVLALCRCVGVGRTRTDG